MSSGGAVLDGLETEAREGRMTCGAICSRYRRGSGGSESKRWGQRKIVVINVVEWAGNSG